MCIEIINFVLPFYFLFSVGTMVMKDSIDFEHTDISKLFYSFLFPTLFGMVFSAMFVITDGVFVGQGIGSDALAAINIASPLFMVTTGMGLMFGVGASVVAGIHLSHGKRKAANINMTQAMLVSTLLTLFFSVTILLFLNEVGVLLGSSAELLPDVVTYMKWFIPGLIGYLILNAGMFFIRLDGAPKFAMLCNVLAALINIFFDYLFIFVFKWGLMGAAFATTLGTGIGAMMVLVYFFFFSRTLSFCKIKASRKSMLLTVRNVGYMVKLGSSGLISELAIAYMMLIGNYVFMHYVGEDGVAAFSIICYLLPIVFMMYNAVAQSAQPIISYNWGLKNYGRISSTVRISLQTALTYSIVFFVFICFGGEFLVSWFVDARYPAYDLATEGLFYFALGCFFLAFNIVSTGYYQSIGRARRATVITVLRGFVFLTVGFLGLPRIGGVTGIWLAVPFAEVATSLYVVCLVLKRRFSV